MVTSDRIMTRNQITMLLIHHLAETGPTPNPDELPERYTTLIEDLLELVTDQRSTDYQLRPATDDGSVVEYTKLDAKPWEEFDR